MELGLHDSRSGRDLCTLYFMHLLFTWWWTCDILVMHLWTLMDLWIYLDGLEHLLLYMWYILCWMCGWMRYICDGWDIYVMDEIYMWWMRYMIVWIYLSWWNVKKLKMAVLGHFAECCTRQRTPLPSAMVTALGKAGKMGWWKTIFPALPSAMTIALGKEFF